MAQQRQSIYVGAPGFRGLNTQDSPVNQDSSFASIAENAVIDKFGRIGARQGIDKITSSTTALGSSAGIETIFEFTKRDGNKEVFSTGNNKIYRHYNFNWRYKQYDSQCKQLEDYLL